MKSGYFILFHPKPGVIMTQSFLNEPKFRKWQQTVEQAGCTIARVTPLHLLHKKSGELLFGLFDADVSAPNHEKLLPIVLVRGDACIVVPLVRNRETGEERFVMIRQRRIGCGADCVEFPAGMVDRNVDDPAAVAAEELREETGLSIDPRQLTPLFPRALYTSPGLQDEAIYYFGCTIEVSDAEYRSIEGRFRGQKSEGENITVTLKTSEDGMRETLSAQVALGFRLFDESRKAC
jgi:8-oxo-dGTP pyrophosphatase MutT (NUDIX family)